MSTSFIHADIFFFVSTVTLVVFMIGIVIAFVYAIGILRNVRDITDRAKAEWQEIVADSRKLRGALRDEGMKWKHVMDLIRTFFAAANTKKIRHGKK
ncbi:MAG TPA: hypothetical protein VFQ72_03640 [Candidatus Paceibacterota bacterium]|nr:hypothetical protein [Candidatus Paceibacterota bacterium]